MRILVVEDEAVIASSVRRALIDQGYAVDVEHDGADGLTQARMVAYDLIVLDVMLPSMSGTDVCQALRADDDWTPVLFLTARADSSDEAHGRELGADDYLTKPFSTVVLLARVAALLRRPRASAEQPFSVGDLRLDPRRHRCLRGDVEIELTAREMEVLAFLVRRAPDTVSKLDLVDNVWGESFDGDPNIAEVYIGHLRRKLDRPDEPSAIRTVRGVGYRLDVGDA